MVDTPPTGSLLDIPSMIWNIYLILQGINLTSPFFSSAYTIYEILAYIPVSIFNNAYVLVDTIYQILYGLISFTYAMTQLIDMLKTAFWPTNFSAVITVLMFLSIGIANSSLILRIVMQIYKKIPIIGGH